MSNGHGTQVRKRNGTVESLNLDKLHTVVDEACEGLGSAVSVSQVEMNSGIQFYDGITTREIQDILVRSASDLISLDSPNYQFVAARLMLYGLRKQVFGSAWLNGYPSVLTHATKCVDKGIYDDAIISKYSAEEWEKINSWIDHDRDMIFTYAGLRQVVDKYLVQDRSTSEVYETPQYMYIMIATTLFQNYKENRLDYVRRYYDAISKHKINIPTPIMAGVRTPLRQFASCVLVDVDDTLNSIFSSDMAIGYYVSQRAGIGINAGRIRGINAKIRGGEVTHTGVIPFLKKFESTVRCCTQNGIRGGSATVHFPIWHQEIQDIIVLKNNKGTEDNRVRKLDYSIQISKLFYERFIQNKDISLFSPHDVPGLYTAFGTDSFDELYTTYEKDDSIPKSTIGAQELILDLLKERAETGRIYIMNIDHCNSHSSFKDHVYMSNLCVSGDTKIEVRITTAKKVDGNTTKIEIQQLEEFIQEGLPLECVEVLSYDVDGDPSKALDYNQITAFAQTSPKAKVMKITDEESGKSIVVTPDHKVYTKNRGYVMAKHLKETDILNYRDETQRKLAKQLLEQNRRKKC